MAVSRASSEWMLHPSLVFKTFEESLIKSPFSYGNSPHIVPEKILESFVDQNGIRCYRVKWLDSWLTEQHVSAAFPHLITEYWINKPINDNVDYQNYINRNLSNLQLPVTSSNAPPTKVPRTTKSLNINETLHHISPQASTSITISQLFNNEVNKEVEIPCTNAESTSKSSGEADFNVSNGLQLPVKVNEKNDGERNKEVKKSIAEVNNSLTDIPKISENSMVFLFNKNNNYTENTTSEREKSPLVHKAQPVVAFNSSFENQINPFAGPPAIRLPSIEQINQQSQQHITNLVQANVSTLEKKVIPIKKSPSKLPKTVSVKDKQPVVCDICGKMISSRKNLRVHKTVKHFKNGSFGCHICGRKFALNRDLKRHMPLHTNERKYQCPHCGLQCKQPGHLTKHIRTHTEVMNWRCDCCFKNFKVQAELKSHCFTEHADISKDNLTCSVCKEKLKLPNSVYLHSLRHSGVREFQCHICKASFKLKQHMQVHMKTHEKPKEIVMITCLICQREFRFKHTYEKHVSKHSEKTREEYEENLRLRQEEKKHKQQVKRLLEVKSRRKRVKDEESSQSNSDEEELKSLQKRKQRKPEKVLYDNDLKTKLLVRQKIKQKHPCPHCEQIFNTLSSLKTHLKQNKLLHLLGNNINTETVGNNEGKQFIPAHFPNEEVDSQLVMLKLPIPWPESLSETYKTDDRGKVTSQPNIKIEIKCIPRTDAMPIVIDRDPEHDEDSEINCGDLSIDIGDENTEDIEVTEKFVNEEKGVQSGEVECAANS